MILFLDTSVVLGHLLDQQPQLDHWGAWEAAYTSELMGVEARRTLDRLRLLGALDDRGLAEAHQALRALEDMLGCVNLSKAVLVRASLPLPTAVKTLDALHLATALLLRETRDLSLGFATHDEQQALAARALGFPLVGFDIEKRIAVGH